MKFYIPLSTDDEEAESVYGSICKFHKATVQSKRIYKLYWYNKYAREYVTTEVGNQAPKEYGGELVIAIIEWSNCYLICTPNRGVARGEAIMVGMGNDTNVVQYFDEVTNNG